MCRLSSRAWRATYDTYAIDLLQLHCPPTEAFYMPEVFDGLDALVKAGKLRHYGVSVEKVEKAIKAMDFPGVPAAVVGHAHRQAQRNTCGFLERTEAVSPRAPF